MSKYPFNDQFLHKNSQVSGSLATEFLGLLCVFF